MEKITATQILEHCKAVVEGDEKDPYVEITASGYGYNLYPDVVHLFVCDTSNKEDLAIAARILGLDRPAPVVLEWKEDELKYESVAHHAYYNGLIECYISANQDGKAKFAWISVNRSRIANMPEKYQHVKTAHEARAWCVEQITKIITPTPKP